MKKQSFWKSCFSGLMSGLAVVMCCLLVALPAVVMSGCTPQQVATFDNTVSTIESHLPQIAEMATGISALVAPEYAPLISPGASVIATDANLIKSLVDGLPQNPTDATVLAKIDGYYQDITSHLNGIIQAVGVKDPKTTAVVNIFAGAVGEILQFVQDLTAKQPAATAQFIRLQMPHVFGGSIIGMHAIAFTTGDAEADIVLSEMGAIETADTQAMGSLSETPTQTTKAKHPIHSVRSVAKTWNVLAKDHPNSKVKVPRARVLGIPIPFTGH